MIHYICASMQLLREKKSPVVLADRHCCNL